MKTVKSRVHLDVNAAAVADLVELGAVVIDAESFPWTVLTDPEGTEFCGFERAPAELVGKTRLMEVVVDTDDPEPITAWWAERFGAEAGHDQQHGYRWIEPAAGLPWPMVFIEVPEPKTVRNRIH